MLRQALVEDIPYIQLLEKKFSDLEQVGTDSSETHQRQLSDPDCAYWIVESEGRPAGFVILRGLASENRCIELKRIVIADPGRGLGRRVLLEIIRRSFTELSAHRLWLDVYEDNSRARHVYRSVGFVEEGMLRECIRRGEQYRSLVLMSILENEYRAGLNL